MPTIPFIEAVLATAPGAERAIVFDIDNTVADTRYRTLDVAREFDARRGSAHFRELGLSQVGTNGALTARAVGAPESIVDDFHSFWQSDDGFWSGSRFVHDRPLQPVASIAQRAAAAGIEVIWLTGRIQALRAATEQWLLAHELPARSLFCKPDLSVRTAPFKAAFLTELCRARSVEFFITECTRDIAAAQTALPSLCCILVDFPEPDACDLIREAVRLALDDL